MTDLVVDLVAPNGMIMAATKIPVEMTVREIVAELVTGFDLLGPRRRVNVPSARYALKWQNNDTDLAEDQTLCDAGVTDGQTLRLYASDEICPQLTEVPVDKTIEVVLTLLELQRDDKWVIETDVPVATLIEDVIRTYDLRRSDAGHLPVVYELWSKWSGRRLSPSTTLAEEGCPSGSRLILRERGNQVG